MELIPIIKTVITFFTIFSIVTLSVSYVIYKSKKKKRRLMVDSSFENVNQNIRANIDSFAYASAGYEQSLKRIPSNYEQNELAPVRNYEAPNFYKKAPVERFRILNEQKNNRSERNANVYGFAKTRQPIVSSFKPQVALVNSDIRENGIFGSYSNRINEPLQKLNFSLTVR